MDSEDVAALAEFCRERAGDQVRAVGLVADGEVAPTYMRDDLQHRYTSTELEGLEGATTGAARAIAEMNTYNTTLGQSHAGLFAFEDAFMLLIPDRAGDAAYVSLDRSVDEGLSTFLKECQDALFSPRTRPREGVDPGGDDAPEDGDGADG